MLHIKEAIVVEGKYDKNTLSQLVDTVILETTGFGIFKDQEKLRLLRKIAQARGLIILTDSDGAGFVIRNYLKGSLPPELVKHAYIPDIHGKEHRKRHWGSEQKLGVEGMSQAVLEASLRRSGATFLEHEERITSATSPITKADLYVCGLTGGDGSAHLRQRLLKELDLPEHLTPNALLPILNALYERDDFLDLAAHLKEDTKK